MDVELWLFNGPRNSYPSAVFSNFGTVDAWIRHYKLTGTLTKYPVDIGVYQWAVTNLKFKPKREAHAAAEFIGSFTSASQEHYHYETGQSHQVDRAKRSVQINARLLNVAWVFTGTTGSFSSGVFSQLEVAQKWIVENSLSGTLVKYPVDSSAYEWAIQNGFFEPWEEHEFSSEFIEIFNSIDQEHVRYSEGRVECS